MMTGPEHYSEAESALDTARLASDRDQAEDAAFWQREAQVHATLALAAATALNQGHAGMRDREWHEWIGAAGRTATAGERLTP